MWTWTHCSSSQCGHTENHFYLVFIITSLYFLFNLSSSLIGILRIGGEAEFIQPARQLVAPSLLSSSATPIISQRAMTSSHSVVKSDLHGVYKNLALTAASAILVMHACP